MTALDETQSKQLPPPGPLREAYAFFEELVALEQAALRMCIAPGAPNLAEIQQQLSSKTDGLNLLGNRMPAIFGFMPPPDNVEAELAKIHKRHIFAVLSYEHDLYGTVFRAYVGSNTQGNSFDTRREYDESWYALRAVRGVEERSGRRVNVFTPDPSGEFLGIGRDMICSTCWGMTPLREEPCVDEHNQPGQCSEWGGWGWCRYKGWSMKHSDIREGIRSIPTTRRKTAQDFSTLLGKPTARHGVWPTSSLVQRDGAWVSHEYEHRAAWRTEFGGGNSVVD